MARLARCIKNWGLCQETEGSGVMTREVRVGVKVLWQSISSRNMPHASPQHLGCVAVLVTFVFAMMKCLTEAPYGPEGFLWLQVPEYLPVGEEGPDAEHAHLGGEGLEQDSEAASTVRKQRDECCLLLLFIQSRTTANERSSSELGRAFSSVNSVWKCLLSQTCLEVCFLGDWEPIKLTAILTITVTSCDKRDFPEATNLRTISGEGTQSYPVESLSYCMSLVEESSSAVKRGSCALLLTMAREILCFWF